MGVLLGEIIISFTETMSLSRLLPEGAVSQEELRWQDGLGLNRRYGPLWADLNLALSFYQAFRIQDPGVFGQWLSAEGVGHIHVLGAVSSSNQLRIKMSFIQKYVNDVFDNARKIGAIPAEFWQNTYFLGKLKIYWQIITDFWIRERYLVLQDGYNDDESGSENHQRMFYIPKEVPHLEAIKMIRSFYTGGFWIFNSRRFGFVGGLGTSSMEFEGMERNQFTKEIRSCFPEVEDFPIVDPTQDFAVKGYVRFSGDMACFNIFDKRVGNGTFGLDRTKLIGYIENDVPDIRPSISLPNTSDSYSLGIGPIGDTFAPQKSLSPYMSTLGILGSFLRCILLSGKPDSVSLLDMFLFHYQDKAKQGRGPVGDLLYLFYDSDPAFYMGYYRYSTTDRPWQFEKIAYDAELATNEKLPFTFNNVFKFIKFDKSPGDPLEFIVNWEYLQDLLGRWGFMASDWAPANSMKPYNYINSYFRLSGIENVKLDPRDLKMPPVGENEMVPNYRNPKTHKALFKDIQLTTEEIENWRTFVNLTPVPSLERGVPIAGQVPQNNNNISNAMDLEIGENLEYNGPEPQMRTIGDRPTLRLWALEFMKQRPEDMKFKGETAVEYLVRDFKFLSFGQTAERPSKADVRSRVRQVIDQGLGHTFQLLEEFFRDISNEAFKNKKITEDQRYWTGSGTRDESAKYFFEQITHQFHRVIQTSLFQDSIPVSDPSPSPIRTNVGGNVRMRGQPADIDEDTEDLGDDVGRLARDMQQEMGDLEGDGNQIGRMKEDLEKSFAVLDNFLGPENRNLLARGQVRGAGGASVAGSATGTLIGFGRDNGLSSVVKMLATQKWVILDGEGGYSLNFEKLGSSGAWETLAADLQVIVGKTLPVYDAAKNLIEETSREETRREALLKMIRGESEVAKLINSAVSTLGYESIARRIAGLLPVKITDLHGMSKISTMTEFINFFVRQRVTTSDLSSAIATVASAAKKIKSQLYKGSLAGVNMPPVVGNWEYAGEEEDYRKLKGPSTFGVAPINPEIPLKHSQNFLANEFLGVSPIVPVLKPISQFSSVVDKVSTIVDSDLFKNKEALLNYKHGSIIKALNDLKRQIKDNYAQRVPVEIRIDKGDGSARFIPLGQAFGKELTGAYPITFKLKSLDKNFKGGKDFGIYMLCNEVVRKEGVDFKPVVPYIQFGSRTKKTFEISLAPYFGYVDSMYAPLKVPNASGREASWGVRDEMQEFQVPGSDPPAIEQVRTVTVHSATEASPVPNIWRITADATNSSKISVNLAGRDYARALTSSIDAPLAAAVSSSWAFTRLRVPKHFPRKTNALEFTSFLGKELSQKSLSDYLKGVIFAASDDGFTSQALQADPTLSVTLVLLSGQGYENVRRPYTDAISHLGAWNDTTALFANEQSHRQTLKTLIESAKNNMVGAWSGFRTDVRVLSGVLRTKLMDGNDVLKAVDDLDDQLQLFVTSCDALLSNSLAYRNWYNNFQATITKIQKQTEKLKIIMAKPEYDWVKTAVQTRAFRVSGPDIVGYTTAADGDALKSILNGRLGQAADAISQRDLYDRDLYVFLPAGCTGATATERQDCLFRAHVDLFTDRSYWIRYIQVLSWIRNFNYSNKMERSKINRSRVTSYLNRDTKDLKKLIYTFGGEPNSYIEKRN